MQGVGEKSERHDKGNAKLNDCLVVGQELGERSYELSHRARLGSHEIGEPREEMSIQERYCSWLQAHRERAIGCRVRARDCREHPWRGGS